METSQNVPKEKLVLNKIEKIIEANKMVKKGASLSSN